MLTLTFTQVDILILQSHSKLVKQLHSRRPSLVSLTLKYFEEHGSGVGRTSIWVLLSISVGPRSCAKSVSMEPWKMLSSILPVPNLLAILS